jgi:hypothetical protein
MECGEPYTYEAYKRQTVPERSRTSGSILSTSGMEGTLYGSWPNGMKLSPNVWCIKML